MATNVGHSLRSSAVLAAISSASTRAALRRALLPPIGLAALAVWLHVGGLDTQVADSLFDASSGVFPWRADRLLELIGHGLAKSAVLLLWCCMVAGAIGTRAVPQLRPYARVLWSIAAAMALGPIIIVVLKEVTTFPCPWNLDRYGGFTPAPDHWFTVPANAGKCFPAGHSAGGFSLVAFYFAALATEHRRLAVVILIAALAAGSAFSLVRVLQGAHFPSHAVWAAAIDWLAAGLVFVPLMSGSARRPGNAR